MDIRVLLLCLLKLGCLYETRPTANAPYLKHPSVFVDKTKKPRLSALASRNQWDQN